MTYKLFLDDYRFPYEVTWVRMLHDGRDWVVVRSYEDFVATIESRGLPDHIAFDHDLADFHYDGQHMEERSGSTCARWLVAYCKERGLQLPSYVVHSMNPVGKENIHQILAEAV